MQKFPSIAGPPQYSENFGDQSLPISCRTALDKVIFQPRLKPIRQHTGLIAYLTTGDHPVDLGGRGALVPVEQVQVLPRQVGVVRPPQALDELPVRAGGPRGLRPPERGPEAGVALVALRALLGVRVGRAQPAEVAPAHQDGEDAAQGGAAATPEAVRRRAIRLSSVLFLRVRNMHKMSLDALPYSAAISVHDP